MIKHNSPIYPAIKFAFLSSFITNVNNLFYVRKDKQKWIEYLLFNNIGIDLKEN